jgi:hypothetical protein
VLLVSLAPCGQLKIGDIQWRFVWAKKLKIIRKGDHAGFLAVKYEVFSFHLVGWLAAPGFEAPWCACPAA